jgi:hypothetical protein
MPCATACRSSPPAARRTSPRWAREWHGPASGVDCGPQRPTPKALRKNILAVLAQPRYRDASRRIAAAMAATPGFDGLATVVDQLIGEAKDSEPELVLDDPEPDLCDIHGDLLTDEGVLGSGVHVTESTL